MSQLERTLRAQEGPVTWAKSISEFVGLGPLFGSQRTLGICISREERRRATKAGRREERSLTLGSPCPISRLSSMAMSRGSLQGQPSPQNPVGYPESCARAHVPKPGYESFSPLWKAHREGFVRETRGLAGPGW